MLSSRSIFTYLIFFILLGCNFKSSYVLNQNDKNSLNEIVFAKPSDKMAYKFFHHVPERLKNNEAAKYILSYSIDISEPDISLKTDLTKNRTKIKGELKYQVIPSQSFEPLLSGKITDLTSFSKVASDVANNAAKLDAENRLLILLVEQTVDELVMLKHRGIF